VSCKLWICKSCCHDAVEPEIEDEAECDINLLPARAFDTGDCKEYEPFVLPGPQYDSDPDPPELWRKDDTEAS
jgi:hypothetical protein